MLVWAGCVGVMSKPSDITVPSRVRRAMRAGQLSLQYQPKVELASGTVVAVEALARWSHPRRGLILPGEFVPQVEASRLASPFNRWVLAQAIEQASAWRRVGAPVAVAINLSPACLQDEALVESVSQLLDLWDLPSELLWIELTEGAWWEASGRAGETLERLVSMGIPLALDDFGVGHSSMSCLVHAPMDVVKIDRSFVTTMASDPRRSLIVQAAIEIAHGLGLRVVAEGVETRAVWDRLCELGCDWAQGFFVSRPVAADAVLERLAQLPHRISTTLRATAASPGRERRAQTAQNQVVRSMIDRLDWVSHVEARAPATEVKRIAAVTAGQARLTLRRDCHRNLTTT
jgi:EAL domain-containing protein (putative c-di-GMP-specific phosphodiesterase class I)